MRTKKHEESEVYEEVISQFKLSKELLDVLHERFNDQEELYRTYLDPNNYPHGAKVFDPRIFRVIETITPRMVANEPTGSFYPSEKGDQVTTKILNALIKYDWRRAEMFPKLVNFVKSMLIFGTAFGRTYWDFRECEKLQMEPKKLNGRMIWTPKNAKKVKYTEFDGPNFETLNIYDCFPDPNATNLHNMRWFIYRTFKTLDELKKENDQRGVEYYKNLDILEEAIDKGQKEKAITDDNQFREHRRVMMGTQEFRGQDESNKEFVVLRRFDREMWVDVVPEYNVVIREEQNPYFHGDLPIVHGVDYPYPGELYGMGEIEPVDRIQRAINAVLNQRLDNVQLTLRSMWKIKKNSGVDMHTLISAPGNIITTDDMAAVESLQVPDVTGSTFVQTMNYLTSALQNGTGVTDYTVGVGNKTVGNTTATGTRLVQQEANAQFKLKVQLFNHMVIQRVANQWKDLRIQYTTEAQKLRIMGNEDIRDLRDNTDLTRISMEGEPIYPGDDREAKMEIGKGEAFAFLNLMPDDIQPSIVGNYDFIAQVSSDQINDPIVLQENFFSALDRVSNPQWVQGLASQGKQLDYASATEKVFDKLQIGIEGRSMIKDLTPPENQDQSQPLPEGAVKEMAGAPTPDMFGGVQSPEMPQQMPDMNAFMGGQNG